MSMDSPWDEDITDDSHHRNVEWDNIASSYTNAGYREGITAGKEGALQEGFDSGFANTGAPLGREVGRARGVSSALVTLFNETASAFDEKVVAEVRDIASRLSNIRFSDIVPPDLEAEEHEREHREQQQAESGSGGNRNGRDEDEDEMDENEEIKAKKDVEGLEDLLACMGNGQHQVKRPTAEDFKTIISRLNELAAQLGLELQFSLIDSHYGEAQVPDIPQEGTVVKSILST